MDNIEQNKVAEENKVPETLDVVNPYDQAYIESLPTVMWDDIDKYLSTAHQLYKDCNQWIPACLLYTSPSPRD